KKIINFAITLFFLPFFIFSENNINEKEAIQYLQHSQDRPSIGSAEVLKNIKRFNFFPGVPAGSKETSERINKEIKNELKKHGKVSMPQLYLKTSEGKEGLDLSSFLGGVSMIYNIQDVYSPSGEKLGIVRASLSIEQIINDDGSNLKGRAYTWSSNCFLPGSEELNLENLVQSSFSYLIEDFYRVYKTVNKTDPCFNLYIP
ncbi:MAG: hypothetical protein EBZ47_09865, partial [Chlamydiae bacterium]|nr:hypothetical protein [Chlamydiota bacterium]